MGDTFGHVLDVCVTRLLPEEVDDNGVPLFCKFLISYRVASDANCNIFESIYRSMWFIFTKIHHWSYNIDIWHAHCVWLLHRGRIMVTSTIFFFDLVKENCNWQI